MEMKTLRNMCRICEKQSTFIDLSHPDHQSYVVKLLSCANVTFQINDALPKHLCRLCTTKLVNFYSFKQKCEETHAKLEKLSHEIDSKNELNLIKFENSDSNFDEFLDQKSNSGDELSVKFEENLVKSVKFEENLIDNDKDLKTSTYNVAEETRNRNKITAEKTRDRSTIKKRTFRCDICRSRSLSKKGIERHMCLSHNMATNLRQCPYCEKFFTGTVYLAHVSKHEKPFKCELCGLEFSCNANLNRHISAVHQKIKKYKCNLCELAFAQKTVLKHHIELLHYKEYKYECSKCDKKFVDKISLNQHRSLKHLTPEEEEAIKLKLYQCKICDQTYKCESSLKCHQNRRSCQNNKKPKLSTHVCQLCGKILSSNHSFYAHTRRHQNITYQCGICNKTLSNPSTLISHKRTHTGEKPYKCTECDMSFIQRQQLVSHMRTHTGEKPYNCKFCSKTFASKKTCTVHIRLHTGEKPHHCVQCTESFIDLNGLKRHRKKFHPE